MDHRDARTMDPWAAIAFWLWGLFGLLVLVWLVGLAGCPMPAPDMCTPRDVRCHDGTPQVCSPGQRWTPADVRCSTVGAACVVRDGVPACLPGGAP